MRNKKLKFGPWQVFDSGVGEFVISAGDVETADTIARVMVGYPRLPQFLAAAPDMAGVLLWWLQEMEDDACDDMGKLLNEMSQKVDAALRKAGLL